MHELLSSAMLDSDVKIDSHQNKWTKCKTDKKGGEGVKKPWM